MKIFVGTSGWQYGWNPEGSLDWYVANSGLNAIELNASFYRFPFPNQIKTWAIKGRDLRWSIKVNRLVTHVFKLGDRGLTIWKKFEKLFMPMDKLIDFYLFQMPPSYSEAMIDKTENFFKKTKLGERFALEIRHRTWFYPESIQWAKELGMTWVSIDSPDFPRDIYRTSNSVYVRMHGRTGWYFHNYSAAELQDVAKRALAAKPRKVYVFFNNNHAMLANGQTIFKILKRAVR
ncbi:MAG: DUF72 domain-containing protein [Candidatus Aenigmatarchaeota archaeon]|nr:DUF72 domain-containing protein [Candidatus Aenigmarchaeota archaeon]